MHSKYDFAYAWKVPPRFIKQVAEDVYADLAWIKYSPSGIPREFFSMAIVESLEYVYICPVSYSGSLLGSIIVLILKFWISYVSCCRDRQNWKETKTCLKLILKRGPFVVHTRRLEHRQMDHTKTSEVFPRAYGLHLRSTFGPRQLAHGTTGNKRWIRLPLTCQLCRQYH